MPSSTLKQKRANKSKKSCTSKASKQQEQDQDLETYVLPERPKRPLSAYNFFFRDERERIMADKKNSAAAAAAAPTAESTNKATTTDGTPITTTSTSSSPAEDNSTSSTSEEVSSKTQTKTKAPGSFRDPGIRAFASLGRAIAAKWKTLNASDRAYYDGLAREEKVRQKQAVTEWKKRCKQIEKEVARKQTGATSEEELEEEQDEASNTTTSGAKKNKITKKTKRRSSLSSSSSASGMAPKKKKTKRDSTNNSIAHGYMDPETSISMNETFSFPIVSAAGSVDDASLTKHDFGDDSIAYEEDPLGFDDIVNECAPKGFCANLETTTDTAAVTAKARELAHGGPPQVVPQMPSVVSHHSSIFDLTTNETEADLEPNAVFAPDLKGGPNPSSDSSSNQATMGTMPLMSILEPNSVFPNGSSSNSNSNVILPPGGPTPFVQSTGQNSATITANSLFCHANNLPPNEEQQQAQQQQVQPLFQQLGAPQRAQQNGDSNLVSLLRSSRGSSGSIMATPAAEQANPFLPSSSAAASFASAARVSFTSIDLSPSTNGNNVSNMMVPSSNPLLSASFPAAAANSTNMLQQLQQLQAESNC